MYMLDVISDVVWQDSAIVVLLTYIDVEHKQKTPVIGHVSSEVYLLESGTG